MAVEPTFLDSGGLVALLNADDWLHAEAVSSFDTIVRAGGPLITTSFVLAEFANSLARTANRVHVMPFIRQLRSLRAADILFVDPVLFDEAAQKYDGTRDKSWGLVDCVSFVVMERRGISRAFTADQHFTQARFQCLLRSRAS